jgi:NAD(P)-dependent dehydrogenase (short-subunit alcohol dehydrogenase family)
LHHASRECEERRRVAITGRDPGRLAEAHAALGNNAIAITTDVADPDLLAAGIAEAAQALGGLDIVFANAGIPGNTPLGSTDPALFARIVGTNLTGAFLTVQAALPHLRDGGSVILNGSVIASLGVPGYAAYAASKGGVSAMARVLAGELAPRGIRVNTLVPGATRTAIWNEAAARLGSHDALETYLAGSIPLGHLGEADDIAKAALFLASDDSHHITAIDLPIDGGTTGAPAAARR